MAGQALYRKWRSQTFEEVVGQEHVTLTLRNALREGRLSHAYLFTGPRGTGKTSTARILAKAVNCRDEDPAARPCNHCSICTAITEARQLDLIEIDAASNRGIDEMRDLREKIGFRPTEARYKVYIVDEVHMLTKEAFNALLKTLEEPPPHAIFVLATTEPDRVPETVRSRCQRFDFRRVPTRKIAEHLAQILKTEGAQASPEALLAIARRSTGSMRDAISLLDQLLSYGDEVLSLTRVENVLGLVDGRTIGQIVDCIETHNAADGLRLINQMVANGVELGELVDQILLYLRAVLFVQMTKAPDLLEMSDEIVVTVTRQAEALSPASVLGALREYSEARSALRDQVPGVPQLPIEMAFVRTALPASAQAVVVPQVITRPQTIVAPPVRASGPQTDKAAKTTASQASIANAEQTPDRTRQTSVEAQPVKEAPAEPQPAADTHGATLRDVELLEAIQQNWNRILELTLKRGGPLLKAAVQAHKQIDVAGETVILQFAHESIRNKVDQGDNRRNVEAAIEEALHHRVKLRCTLIGDNAPAPPQTSTQPASSKAGSDDDALLSEARKLGAVVKKLDQSK